MSTIRNTGHHLTEKINQHTTDIDELSTAEIVDLIAKEDSKVLRAVSRQKENISAAAVTVEKVLKKGGRVFFVGAGTSGRLGVLEAAECPPTFGTNPSVIQAIIAGGMQAVWNSIEGAEDSETESVFELKEKKLSQGDVVVGIAASSSTPFVISAINFAKKTGSATVLVTCSPADIDADVNITLLTGPEVIVGSTRLKSGTATKMVLNMITTASMVKLGKTYGNLMVDVQPKSSKLKDRAIRIVCEICEVEKEDAVRLLDESGWNVKIASVMKIKNLSRPEAEKLLEKNNGFLKKTIKETNDLA